MSNPPPDPDDLAAAVAAMKQLPVPDTRPAVDDVLARLTAGTPPPVVPTPRRRWLMRIASFSLAASVLAAVGGLLLFAGSPRVALADVVKAAEKHTLVKYKMVEVSEQDEEPKTGTTEYTCFADLKAPRFRTEHRLTTLNGALDAHHWTVQDNARDRVLSVTTETVTEAGKTDPALVKLLDAFAPQGVPRTTAVLRPVPELPNVDPKLTLLANLRALETHKDAKAEAVKEGGRKALKYEVEDGPRTTTLWVDADTKLPVRMVVEVVFTNARATKSTITFSDFEWDPKLKGFKDADELFTLTPPDGHTLDDQTKKK